MTDKTTTWTLQGPPLQKIPQAAKSTGLSPYFLRKGCKDGSIPHVKSGDTYYINVLKLLQQLNGDND